MDTLAGERPIGRMAFCNIIKMQISKVFFQNFGGILYFQNVCMNQLAISFNLICYIQFSAYSVFFCFPYFPANAETEIRIFGYR